MIFIYIVIVVSVVTVAVSILVVVVVVMIGEFDGSDVDGGGNRSNLNKLMINT